MSKKEKVSEISDSKFDQKQETWSQRTEKNGITESITVEKLANQGYLVTLSKYGSLSNGKYIDKSKKLYSETNPLDKDETNDPITEMFNTLSNNKK